MPDSKDYLAIVRTALAAALGVDEDEVEPDATVMGDLDVESIDLLDVLFRLERLAGVRIQSHEIADMLQGDLSDEEFEAPDGTVTAAGLEQLHRVLPQIDPAALAGTLVADGIMALFTVRNLAELVAQRAGEKVHAH